MPATLPAASPEASACLRAPIVDRRRRVIGYEVFPGGEDAAADPAAGARVLLHAFSGPDLGRLAGRLPVYATLAHELLAELDLLPVASDRLVLQVDLTTPPAAAVRTAVERQAQLGFAIAATGVDAPAALAALPSAAIVRVDVDGLGPDAAAARIAAFAGRGLAVHARGVHDHAVRSACLAAGAEALQGAFWGFADAAIADGDGGAALATAAQVLDPSADLDDLERIIAHDVALTYGILRYANSAFFARRTEIATVRQACATLGERMTRRWALIVALGAATGAVDAALTGEALLRARTMELLAEELPGLSGEVAFTVGLLSLAPGLVGVPMDELVAGLALPAELERALVDGAPPYGALLRQVAEATAGGGPAPARLSAAYASALDWVAGVLPAIAVA